MRVEFVTSFLFAPFYLLKLATTFSKRFRLFFFFKSFSFYIKIDPSKSRLTLLREAVRDVNVVFVTFQVNMLKDCLLNFSVVPRKRSGKTLPPSFDLRQSFPETILKSSRGGPSLTKALLSLVNLFQRQAGPARRRACLQIFVEADFNFTKVHSERIV